MKKAQHSQIVTLDIEASSHDGRGIATYKGKTTFVSGAIAHEKVSCKITKRHSRYNEAETIEILEASPQRTTPSCAHYGKCGGCGMQHMEIQAQIELKEKIVLDQLKRIGKVIPETVMPPLSGNPWNYRRKARLGVRYDKKLNKLFVGFRAKNSNQLINVQNCPVLHASVGTKIAALHELIQNLTQFDNIPQIEVAVSPEQTALIFRHLTPLPEEDITKLCDFAEKNNMHFYLQPNPPEKIHKIWPKDTAEKLTYTIDLPLQNEGKTKSLTLQFHPLDFVQVNEEVNQLLLKQALELLDLQATDTVLDLFCGLGNFTLPISLTAQHVTGVEGSQEMVARAQTNATLNNITNTEFYAANLMDPSALGTPPWMRKKYNKILLDPPRSGAKEILPLLPKFSAKRIVYVSCDPATLARDAGELVYNYGYKLIRVGVVNMFPHTNHIEAIALFVK